MSLPFENVSTNENPEDQIYLFTIVPLHIRKNIDNVTEMTNIIYDSSEILEDQSS